MFLENLKNIGKNEKMVKRYLRTLTLVK